MSSYVPAALRRAVAKRAHRLCEYCLIHEDDTFFGCQIEHIIAEKHSGGTIAENLAYACVFCNRCKGSDVGSIHPHTAQLVRLFNPRSDRWAEHFALEPETLAIRGVTEIGLVTVRLLEMNHPDRLSERAALAAVGRYPSKAAEGRLI